MFNISETSTKINGLPEGVTFGQLQYSLYHKERHSKPKYEYFGKFVSRGTMDVLVSKGLLKIYFYEKSGWAKEIDILDFIPKEEKK